MNFIADLHIHSRFSRATSKALTPRHLAAWAVCKGIDVLGTGDFTHPQWRAELREQLVLDENSGLYRLQGPPETLPFMQDATNPLQPAPLFCLQAEISSIYKRHGKVRKVHNLVFVPSLEDAERLSQRLAQIGNLNADGRPILGLDSRDLLEITLDTCHDAVLIPAHVWTPWFAIFGSKSGFDRLEDCFDDLSSHIFALETGLSSDPAMNRMLSQLDGYALISNSDAHSGPNLGREGNLFYGSPSYDGIFSALRAAARREDQESLDCRFLGTLEFYPEEGKYHLDGHRACQVVLDPREANALGNICPVCGKPLTIGVLHRVLELADRESPAQLPLEPEARSLIPLPELISEIIGFGTSSRKVQERYAQLLRQLGSELDILCTIPESDIRTHWEPLGEAISRMRSGQVFRQGGYDGEYGVVRVFEPGELVNKKISRLPGIGAAFSRKEKTTSPTSELHAGSSNTDRAEDRNSPKRDPAEQAFSEEQKKALQAGPGPVLVAAGPGAGKTRVLIGRLQWLLEKDIRAENILALTFTRRAAAEMRERLARALPGRVALPFCDTLHGLAWKLVHERRPGSRLLDEDAAFRLFASAQIEATPLLTAGKEQIRFLWDALQLAREKGTPLTGPLAQAASCYTARKIAQTDSPWLDYGDLLEELLRLAPQLAGRWHHILVDEVQDLSPMQLRIIRAFLPDDGQGFFGIGDPDQAIYGFRAASGHCERDLLVCWPDLTVCRLGFSYRASQGILDMAQNLLQGSGHCGTLRAVHSGPALLRLFAAPDDQAEARWVSRRVQRLLGGSSHSLLDRYTTNTDAQDCTLDASMTPGDIAVLVRLKAQIPPLLKALEEVGIACNAPSQEDFRQDPICSRLLTLVSSTCAITTEKEVTCRSTDMDRIELPWTADTLPAPQAMTDWLQGQSWAGEGVDLFCKGKMWRAFCRLWNQCGNWPTFLERLVWMQEAEMLSAKAEKVQIMTLHASKGLEFQAVFLPGLENGLLPLKRELLWDIDENDEERKEEAELMLAEERRLLYVGLTRAARALFISYCTRRMIYGHKLQLAPSPFIAHIGEFCRQSRLTLHKRTSMQHLSLLS